MRSKIQHLITRALSLSFASALTFTSAATVVTVAPSEAAAQDHHGRRVTKRRTATKRTVRHHDTRRTRRHHNRTSRHRHRSGVRITVGTPYVHHGVHNHHYYDHRYDYGYTYRTYPTHTRVVVVEAPEAEWQMPALQCPVRSEEARTEREQWCATSRGTRHGLYRRWYDDGVLAAQGEYAFDQKEGVWLEFHPNGALREEGQYVDGKRDGTWITWGADGEELVSVDY